ncbi:ribonuclease H-like domain-containing protein [Mycena vitilis]|nr:ribonuclease H-like domain-containing protein [Mycena vitilis]
MNPTTSPQILNDSGSPANLNSEDFMINRVQDKGSPHFGIAEAKRSATYSLCWSCPSTRDYCDSSAGRFCTNAPSAGPGREYVVVADSEYVVKGITERVPKWKENNWKTSKGGPAANGDLFRQLDAAVVAGYERQGLTIKFLHVARELNNIADQLAKQATALPVLTS